MLGWRRRLGVERRGVVRSACFGVRNLGFGRAILLYRWDNLVSGLVSG